MMTSNGSTPRSKATWRPSAKLAREFGEECGTEDVEYCKLLRIANAVEEARKEIDVQALQDLIDSEHKMDAGDWVRSWEDRGFSGASEPNDVWDKAFAHCAARLFQKPKDNCNN
jgi:hypothetical protein